jgi:hypothetical protein
MNNYLLGGLVVTALFFSSHAVCAQTPSPKVGAAEKPGKTWPYPEPAQRGATGYSPDYSEFKEPNERWDVYVNILWRKTIATNKFDVEYYDYELSQFLDSVPPSERAKFKSASGLLMVMKRIRANKLKLPYRDSGTGCALFFVKHDKRADLAADDCNFEN